MIKHLFVVSFIVVCQFACAERLVGQDSSEGAPTKTEVVQKQVRSMIQAVYTADVETLLKYSHPKVIEILGGRDNARLTLEQTLTRFQERGITLESFDFPEKPTFLKSNQHEYVIVPTLSVIAVGAQRIKSQNYQVGIRDLETNDWTYIEGSRLSPRNVRSFFPNFPKDYQFPPISREKL